MKYKHSPAAATLAISISLVVIVLAILALLFSRKPAVTIVAPGGDTGIPALTLSGNTNDLVASSLAPGASVSGVMTITGSLQGSYFFEATAQGSVLDADKKLLKRFPLSATGDWMTAGPVPFSGSVDLTGIPPGNGYIRLGNDNPSGDPSRDKYVDIPVVFQ